MVGMYAAIDTETKLLLDIAVFDHHGTEVVARFLTVADDNRLAGVI